MEVDYEPDERREQRELAQVESKEVDRGREVEARKLGL